jgi:hypothetical protein
VGYTDKVFLKEYDIQENEHFIQYVFLPYFKDIFKDLSARSDKPQEGINRLVFLDVSPTIPTFLISENNFLFCST